MVLVATGRSLQADQMALPTLAHLKFPNQWLHKHSFSHRLSRLIGEHVLDFTLSRIRVGHQLLLLPIFVFQESKPSDFRVSHLAILLRRSCLGLPKAVVIRGFEILPFLYGLPHSFSH